MDDNPLGSALANNTEAAITFTEAPFDTNGMWSAAQPTRVTCTIAGIYYITINAFWNANATGYRRIRIRQNGGATILAGASQNAVTTAGIQTDQNAVKAAWQAVPGDYVEIVAIQTSGGSLTGFFAMTVFEVAVTL